MIQKKQNAQLQVVLSVFTKVQAAVPAMAKCFSAHFRPGCEETLKSQKILSDFDSFMIVCNSLSISSSFLNYFVYLFSNFHFFFASGTVQVEDSLRPVCEYFKGIQGASGLEKNGHYGL